MGTLSSFEPATGAHLWTGEAGDVEAEVARARAACQRHIQDLQAELAEAERHNDFARSERISEELDAVIEQLSAAIGLGGRGRGSLRLGGRGRKEPGRHLQGEHTGCKGKDVFGSETA